MSSEKRWWVRQGEAFWRAHHEAWKRSDLNQRQYCELHGLPQKAFENWRQKFRAEPQPPERKLLYRRCPLSPPISPPVSPPISPLSSPGTYPSSHQVPSFRARVRAIGARFNDADKHRILEEAARAGTSAAEVAHRYGIARRLLRRWKQELAAKVPTFVTVQVTVADTPSSVPPIAEGPI